MLSYVNICMYSVGHFYVLNAFSLIDFPKLHFTLDYFKCVFIWNISFFLFGKVK